MGNIDYEKDMKLLLEISLIWYNIFTNKERKMNAVIPKEHMKTHCNWGKGKRIKRTLLPQGERQKNSWC